VVATDRTVVVGTVPLSAGQRQTVSDTTDVAVGDSVRLRIHPGGGDNLSRAREEARTLEGDLRKALDRYGLGSISAAAEVVSRRADLQAKADAKEAALKEWDAADLATLSKEADEEWAAITADIRRREEQLAAAEPPGAQNDAEALLGRAQAALQSTESEEKALRVKLDALREQVIERENERNLSRESIEGERKRHTELSAQVELLLQNHGSDEIRTQAMEEERNTKAKLEAELAKTRGSLEALQPELLEADRDRLQRAWKETEDQRQDAEKVLAVSQFTLRSDGADDPHAALSQAEARLEAAREHLAVVDRKARAIALVDDLFQEEQRTLADQFSKPLADKIDSYLQGVFGPEARASLEFEDNHFKGVRLARGVQAGARPFAKLSHGAREQVAAAVRLAIAELLAADHDGSLPIVFDDAFTNSDPERVGALQRMLDLGAARGLQVIVLTCNPADYAGLGARETILPKPATL
jgi:DNA repair exonuclease SbcCD ATPase subunit